MTMHIEGIENWGKVFQAKSPLDGRAAAGPDYSFQTIVAAVPAPDAEANDWAALTGVHLNAPSPIGHKFFAQAIGLSVHTPSEHTFHDKHYDLEYRIVFGDPTS